MPKSYFFVKRLLQLKKKQVFLNHRFSIPTILHLLKKLISFTFFSLTKKSNKKSQAKTPNPFFLAHTTLQFHRKN